MIAVSALRHRNFRLFWTGHAVSSVGTRMQQAGLLWHLYELSGSAVALGAMGAARLVPVLLTSLWGGVVADRLPRQHIVLVAQACLGLVSLGLGLLALSGTAQVWHLFAAAVLLEVFSAFDGPARKALVPTLVPPELLPAALSLTSITKNGARLAGPAMMGVTVASIGIGWVYLSNAMSFAVVIWALVRMTVTVPERKKGRGDALAEIAEGARYLRNNRLLLVLLGLDFTANLWAGATVLLPIFAAERLGGGPELYGLLASAGAAGGLVASAALLVLPTPDRPGRAVFAATCAFGVATMAFGLAHHTWVAWLALAAIGGADQFSTVLRTTVYQLVVPDALRGRLTAIQMLFTKGGPRLGELEAGVVAAAAGLGLSIVSGGVACVVSAVALLAWAPELWRVDLLGRLDGEGDPA